MYFNVNFNMFFKLIKVHLLVSELYVYQNARCNDKKISFRDVITQFDCTYRRTGINDNYEIEKLGNSIEEFVREETTLNTEIKLRGSKYVVIFFLLQEKLIVFQERLCYVECSSEVAKHTSGRGNSVLSHVYGQSDINLLY